MIKISFLGCVFSLSLLAGTFTETFEDVPKKFSNCHEQAAELARLFLTQTGNKNGAVACMKDNGKVSTYELSYTAEKPLPYATTDIFTVYKNGIYKTLQECQDKLTADIDKFETNTALPKLIGYCKGDFSSLNRHWSPFIFAFGEPKKNYFISAYYYKSLPYKVDTEAFLENIKVALERKGAVLANGAFVSDFGYGTLQIHYYAKDRISFDLLELSESLKYEQCLANLDRLNLALKAGGLESVTTYCGEPTSGSYWQLATLFVGGLPLTTRPSIESYQTLELCEADRDRLTQYYIASVDKKILEGFCSIVEDTHRVLFIRGR